MSVVPSGNRSEQGAPWGLYPCAGEEQWVAITCRDDAEWQGLRAAMDRRRSSRSAPQRVIERLLGFDVKLRQYEHGKRWADQVAGSAGIEALNRVWSSPEALPTADELQHPGQWLKRTEPPRLTAA